MKTFLFKTSIVILVICQVLVPVFSQCTLTCSSTEVLDLKACKCVAKIDCAIQQDDPIECQDLMCDASTASICPKKCFCERPSEQNNYCLPCLHGGSIDPKTCACKCKLGFQGPQCQHTSDPCKATDGVFCGEVDCWNSTYTEFFDCPLKCMCCQNKYCMNLGKLLPDCTCECLYVPTSSTDPTNIYDASKNCEIKTCVDDRACTTQFFVYTNPSNCNNDFVRGMCPKACKVCQ